MSEREPETIFDRWHRADLVQNSVLNDLWQGFAAALLARITSTDRFAIRSQEDIYERPTW